jgi:hypothetical protein
MYICIMKTYIYTLSHPITNEVRYVGKTVNPKQRKHNHSNIARDKGTHKRNWINLLKTQKLRPLFEIIDEVDSDWKFWEKYWISQFKVWGFTLCNHTLGGDGLETGNQTSFKKGQIPWNTGIGNKKICITCNESFSSCVTARKITCSKKCASIYRSKNLTKTVFKKGFIPWNNGIKGFKLKPDKNVYQFNKEKTIMIKKWNTAKEAGSTLNINVEGIGQCAREVSKSSGGFYWTYKNILQ